MTNDSSSSVPPTDTALPTAPVRTRRYDTNNERVFLAQQAADAKAAMQHTVDDMKVTVQQAANVRWWTQHYPWYAVGAAAVLGFVAATRVLTPPSHYTPPAQPANGQTAAGPSWTAPLFEMLRSTLMSAIIGAVHSSGQTTGQEQARAEPSDRHIVPHQ
jgi:hypothetical protein